MGRYFGTDGIRARVGEPLMSPEFVLKLGHAAGRVLARHAHGGAKRAAVLIGKDTRISGYMIESALEAGLSAAGVDVVLCGPLPTPGVAYLTRALRLEAGIVVSASHNPYPDNGIKFFGPNGEKLPDELEAEIEATVESPLVCREAHELGRARRLDDAAGRYIEFCKSTFPASMSLDGLRLVLDCAHGAAYQVAPAVFHELGAEVVALANQPNGFNINEGVGATHPEYLQAMVRAHRADLGIAFDGDGDRVIMADAEARLYDGDALLYVIVRDRVLAGQRLGGVVGTLMSNLGLEHAVHRLGVRFERTKVGDRYVAEALRERGWEYGGESSGHLLCLGVHTTGDGIISALQVLAALLRRGETLAQACADLVRYPQVLRNVSVPRGYDWKDHPGVLAACRAAEAELAAQGRILLRPSGTEPLLRVMVEGRDASLVQRWADALAAAIESSLATESASMHSGGNP
jgi:phosphoglucosamine mutase